MSYHMGDTADKAEERYPSDTSYMSLVMLPNHINVHDRCAQASFKVTKGACDCCIELYNGMCAAYLLLSTPVRNQVAPWRF